MILSASRRTDIPCCYSDWFIHRIHKGFAYVRNPMNASQLFQVPLTPDLVDCIVFWTKDPQPLILHLSELDQLGYHYYFQFTLTPYGKNIERNLRPKPEIEETFITLSKRIGRNRVVWRYDPIILNNELTIAYHKANFRRMCTKLAPYTDTVTISFVDLYAKIKNAPVRTIEHNEMEELAAFIAETAHANGLKANACCETVDLRSFGISHANCIDRSRIEQICGCPLNIKDDSNQRKGCGCCESIDIGAYNTCLNGCVYCYANSAKSVCPNHNPAEPLLNGTVRPGETVRVRKVTSFRQRQTSLFDDA